MKTQNDLQDEIGEVELKASSGKFLKMGLNILNDISNPERKELLIETFKRAISRLKELENVKIGDLQKEILELKKKEVFNQERYELEKELIKNGFSFVVWGKDNPNSIKSLISINGNEIIFSSINGGDAEIEIKYPLKVEVIKSVKEAVESLS